MATKDARAVGLLPGWVPIAEGQTGNGATTHIADRGTSHKITGTLVRIATSVGATPTCTYQIEVSADGTTWVNATYADYSTPTSDSTASFALTTGTVVKKIVKHAQQWRYVRVTMSANTNVTNWIDVMANDQKNQMP